MEEIRRRSLWKPPPRAPPTASAARIRLPRRGSVQSLGYSFLGSVQRLCGTGHSPFEGVKTARRFWWGRTCARIRPKQALPLSIPNSPSGLPAGQSGAPPLAATSAMRSGQPPETRGINGAGELAGIAVCVLKPDTLSVLYTTSRKAWTECGQAAMLPVFQAEPRKRES